MLAHQSGYLLSLKHLIRFLFGALSPLHVIQLGFLNGHFIALQSKVDGTIAKAGAFNSRVTQELFMKLATTMLVVGAMFAGTALANAQGASEKTPGDQMQDKGSVKGSPGASGYAPGHEMQKKGSVKGTEGASGYAPGRSTTGSKTDKDDTTTKSK
jgi:hypothetical protein